MEALKLVSLVLNLSNFNLVIRLSKISFTKGFNSHHSVWNTLVRVRKYFLNVLVFLLSFPLASDNLFFSCSVHGARITCLHFSLPNESHDSVQTVLHTARANISGSVPGPPPDDRAAPGSPGSFWTTALQPAKKLRGTGAVKTGTPQIWACAWSCVGCASIAGLLFLLSSTEVPRWPGAWIYTEGCC